MFLCCGFLVFFFFNDTATTEIYTLSLHDALPISLSGVQTYGVPAGGGAVFETRFEKDASGEGVYAFVTHAVADAAKGAVGLIRVGAPELAAGEAHEEALTHAGPRGAPGGPPVSTGGPRPS